jgi:hypothetical protein
MNAIAEKLEAAGVDTIGARLTTSCTEAIRRHPDSVGDAWALVGTIFGHEFVRGLMGDMRGPQEPESPPATLDLRDCHVFKSPAPYKPRVIQPERLQKRQELQAIIRIRFGYKTADGTDWAQVGAHELDGMDRDGAMARAVKARIGVLTNEDRFRKIGDLMTAKQFEEVANDVRKHPIKEIMK